MTVVVAFMCFFLLCDSPRLSGRWLEPDDIRYLELRQMARRATNSKEFKESNKHFDLQIFKDILCDYKIYLLIFANWSNAVPNYAMKVSPAHHSQSLGVADRSSLLCLRSSLLWDTPPPTPS